MSQRIGLGEDRHRLDEPGTGPLRLGGVDVPHDHGLVGHSDADVLLHAITDALLGAAGLPDIGELFPNDAQANRDRDSADFLRLAIEKVRAVGYELANLDCVVSRATAEALAVQGRDAARDRRRLGRRGLADRPQGEDRRRRRPHRP